MRVRIIGIVAVGILGAACGDSSDDRMRTGGLGGAAAGALVGGPVGAIVGGGVGVAGGAALDQSADEKINALANPTTDNTRQMATASGAADGGRVLTAEQVHRKLHDEGYASVYNIRREGSTHLARGERDGRAYDIRTDAYSGRIIASTDVGHASSRAPRSGSPARQLMSERQVRDALHRDGYEITAPLSEAGRNYRTQVRHNDDLYDVTVDRRLGKIVRATPTQTSGMPSRTATVPSQPGRQ
jgi:hypothetical protein